MKWKHGMKTVSLLCVLLCLGAAASAAPAESGTPQQSRVGTLSRWEPEEEPELGQDEYTGGVISEEEEAEEQERDSYNAATDSYDAINLDNFTGEPIGSAYSRLVVLSDTCTYDKELDEFNIYVGNKSGSSFASNIPNHAIVQIPVELRIPTNLLPVLYRNGEEVTEPDYENITDVGTYSLSLNRDGETVAGIFTFQIIGEVIGDAYVFEAPEFFSIRSASNADGSLVYSDYEVNLREEGEYTIHYSCYAVDKTYTLNFTIDHTPPELTFDGVVDGIAKGPVTIYGYEQGDNLEVYLNSTQVNPSLRLTDIGTYVIRITDAAGNYNEYSFAIRTYLDTTTWVLFGCLFALAVAALLFIFTKRKKFRNN